MLEAGRLVSAPTITRGFPLYTFTSRDVATPTNQHLPPQPPFFTQDRCKHCTGRSQHQNPRAANKIYTACALEDIASVEHSTTDTGIVVGNIGDVFGAVHLNISDTSSEADLSLIPRLMVAADIDAATTRLAIGILGPFLSAFGFLFILRIVMSWYPKLPVEKFPYVIAYAPTEPLLAVTRKVIPPLAGVDVTPVVWFGLVSFLNEILVGPQGLLVLLSQQLN